MVRGVAVPLVGRVAMDAVMADVTDVPGDPVTERDEFVLLGRQGTGRDHRPRPRRNVRNDQLRGGHVDVPPIAPGVPCRGFTGGGPDARGREVRVARIELWNGDICDLEVDAIVSPASTSLWMSTGVAGELKRIGGDEIEFAAVRQAPVELGDAIVTPAGRLAAKVVDPCRVPRARPPDERRGDRPGRAERDGAGARAGPHERRVPGARDRHRRLPHGRGRAGSRSTRFATSSPPRRRSST